MNGEQPEIQMQKFANFYGEAFQDVVAGQFPWMKMFRENTIIKLVDPTIPSGNSLDIILEDLLTQQASSKGSKRGVQQISSKSKLLHFMHHNDLVNGKFPLLYMISGGNSVLCFENHGIRILSASTARTILVNGAVRKGERLVPPSSFDILMRVTFPASSARDHGCIKALAIGVVAFAVAAAVVSPNIDVQEWSKLYVGFSS
ncbi:hypothetical protein V6N13_142741 [Hibiscus sabdariffa]